MVMKCIDDPSFQAVRNSKENSNAVIHKRQAGVEQNKTLITNQENKRGDETLIFDV